MLKRQSYHPKVIAGQNVIRISQMGGDESADGEQRQRGWRWRRHQVCRGDNFSLIAVEGYFAGQSSISYFDQEDYIKANFLLNGRRTTVLNGFGQYDHDRPEVCLFSGPMDMIKMDMLQGDTQVAQVCLGLRREFFSKHLGLEPEGLPQPLRAMVVPDEKPYAFHSFSFTASLAAATRAVLAAPFAVRREPAYAQAKAIELMYLLINRLSELGENRHRPCEAGKVPSRWRSRLYDARELLSRDYAKTMTLEGISREVGLSKIVLINGFRQLFGMSVHDCLQRERMEHAYELLQDESYTVAQVAEAVGYRHACNFSTAFRAFYGHTPQKIRSRER